jgi:2-amino-1-hydroxyethylphosphonate dioxygenase (glycine-forming)
MNLIQATAVADEIIKLFKAHGGSEYAGEKVTQLEHMYQSAELAKREGFEEEVILAAFLHDIGHICETATGDNEMDGFGIKDHEEVGAFFLKDRGFSQKLIRLVESHVEAIPITMRNCLMLVKKHSNIRAVEWKRKKQRLLSSILCSTL